MARSTKNGRYLPLITNLDNRTNVLYNDSTNSYIQCYGFARDMGKKQSQLEMTVTSIQQRYGALVLTKGRPLLAGTAAMIPHISTSFAALDKALGIGGLARGRVSEILGPATSGKTTLALKFLVQAQVNEGRVGYIDYAHAFDPDYAYRCGLDLSRLLIATPYDLAEALVTTEALATSGALSALVFDGPDTLCNDDMDSTLLAACIDRMVAPLARAGTVLLFLRAPVARVASGLSALAHHATVRLYITRERWLRSTSLRGPAQATATVSPSVLPPRSGRSPRPAEARRPALLAGQATATVSPSVLHPALLAGQARVGRSASLRGPHSDIRGYEGRVEILKNRLGPAGHVVTITIRFNGTVRGEGL